MVATSLTYGRTWLNSQRSPFLSRTSRFPEEHPIRATPGPGLCLHGWPLVFFCENSSLSIEVECYGSHFVHVFCLSPDFRLCATCAWQSVLYMQALMPLQDTLLTTAGSYAPESVAGVSIAATAQARAQAGPSSTFGATGAATQPMSLFDRPI